MLIQKENPNLIPAGFKSSWKDYYFVEMGPKDSKDTGAVVDGTFKVNKKTGEVSAYVPIKDGVPPFNEIEYL